MKIILYVFEKRDINHCEGKDLSIKEYELQTSELYEIT